MRQLLLFFRQYYYVFLFFCLEIIALFFLFSRNNYQQAKFLNSTSVVQTAIDNKRKSYTDFFSLRKENTLLAEENVALLQKIEALKTKLPAQIDSLKADSVTTSSFDFQVAKVISNPMNTSHSHITINKGANQGVKEQAGLMVNNSAVGKVVLVKNNFSLVMPIFHTNSRINIKHLPSKYTGNLVWNGANFNTIQAEKIPRNATIHIGDTIVTNQYSKSFPEETLVGMVKEINYDATKNFYVLDIEPFVDFAKLNMAYVVQRKDFEAIQTIEEQQ